MTNAIGGPSGPNSPKPSAQALTSRPQDSSAATGSGRPGARLSVAGGAQALPAATTRTLPAATARTLPAPLAKPDLVKTEMRGLVRDIAAQPPVDLTRVERLSQQINAGAYRVDASRLADAMIASLMPAKLQ